VDGMLVVGVAIVLIVVVALVYDGWWLDRKMCGQKTRPQVVLGWWVLGLGGVLIFARLLFEAFWAAKAPLLGWCGIGATVAAAAIFGWDMYRTWRRGGVSSSG